MSTSLLARSFEHGVHPDEHKDTAHLGIERMPFVKRYVMPLGQHIGAPCKAIVRAGQRVERGQRIADPGGFVSTSLHSPVAGRVVAVAKRRHPNGSLQESIEIEADPFSSQRFVGQPIDWEALTREELVRHIQLAGLVGLGGAAFPAHVKYAPLEGKPVQWLVVNGCECEPYLTADHRLMLERAELVIRGAHILRVKLGARGVKIGVELNKSDAIAALERAARGAEGVEVVGLRVKYPQGAEKMLIHALFKREVPAGKLPIDLGIVVNNVATVAATAEYFDQGKPLIERVVTVAGPAIEAPANLVVPLGTPISEVLAHRGIRPETRQLIMGGPMMGMPLASADVPVLKGTSGILAFTETTIDHDREYTCIRCGRCLEACANLLNPSRLARLAKARRYEEMEESYVLDCMECGACTFACPSGVPIVQLIRVAKSAIRDKKAQLTPK